MTGHWLEWGLWITTGSLFFLSLWILIPAPLFSLLPLSVGVPELSPILWLISWGVMGLVGLAIYTGYITGSGPFWVGLVAWGIFSIPLVMLPSTIRHAADLLQPMASGSQPSLSIRYRLTGIPLPAIAPVREEVFARPEGIPLTLRIYRPGDEAIHPGVLVIYGGAWQRGSSADNAQANQFLAGQGYTVIALDYRHAPAYRFPAALQDVKRGWQYVQDHAVDLKVDVQRMAVMGRSAGGHLAMLLAYQTHPSPFRAVVNFYGPVDLARAYAHPPRPDPINTRAVLEAFLGGSPAVMPERYRQASPIHSVGSQKPPTLLIYGRRDHIVPPHYGRLLAQQLSDQGNSAFLVEIPWADHAFDAVFSGLSSQLALETTRYFLSSTLVVNYPS
ncbi:MAG: alpha/beta hydrolase [Cyanobacteriota bacterium]|nr:alpha/beta hydrolase [Cyanobacteriota bacterium]